MKTQDKLIEFLESTFGSGSSVSVMALDCLPDHVPADLDCYAFRVETQYPAMTAGLVLTVEGASKRRQCYAVFESAFACNSENVEMVGKHLIEYHFEAVRDHNARVLAVVNGYIYPDIPACSIAALFEERCCRRREVATAGLFEMTGMLAKAAGKAGVLEGMRRMYAGLTIPPKEAVESEDGYAGTAALHGLMAATYEKERDRAVLALQALRDAVTAGDRDVVVRSAETASVIAGAALNSGC